MLLTLGGALCSSDGIPRTRADKDEGETFSRKIDTAKVMEYVTTGSE